MTATDFTLRRLASSRDALPMHDTQDFEDAVLVFQLADVEHGLALAAHVHERDFRADADNGAFDGLPLGQRGGPRGGLEQRRELVLLWLSHSTSMVSPQRRGGGPTEVGAGARRAEAVRRRRVRAGRWCQGGLIR